jgi:translation elongation factor EF-G
MTFDECQGAADRMFAYAVLVAQAAKEYMKCVYHLNKVDGAITNLLSVLTAERAQSLTPEQREHLIHRLQEAHAYLVQFARSREAKTMREASFVPVIPGLVIKLQEGTDELGDVIENLILMGDQEYLTLVSTCATSLGRERKAELAGMHG